MRIVFSEKAEEELDDAEQSLRRLFVKHAEKIASLPPKRHLKFGLPFNVEEVTRQARMVYNFENDDCYILHCFKNHKEYERWYKSFK
ncbi:MAG: hypothetical protein V1847_02100 [Candidatus Diapherotrites archaeon]